MKKNSIKITSKHGTEFDSEVILGQEKYLVQTEWGGAQKPHITTRVYLKGQVVFTRKTDCGDIMNDPDMPNEVRERMVGQHQSAIATLKAERSVKTKTTSDYLDEVKNFLKTKNKRAALRVLNEALEHYPDDPFILSYYGCLEAVANKNYTLGIETCEMALENLKKRVPFGQEFFYPVFYLNLGRAYLAAGRKDEAVGAFNRGIQIDRENKDLIWEIKKLGTRRKPAVPFFKRSNPINKYIGMLLHSSRK
jgi:tetratricopeptide (TPR) repeat protein